MYQFHWNKLKWFNSSQNEILGVGSQFSQISKIACSEWMYEENFFRNMRVSREELPPNSLSQLPNYCFTKSAISRWDTGDVKTTIEV